MNRLQAQRASQRYHQATLAQAKQHVHNAQTGVKRQRRWWHWALWLLAIELVVSVGFFVSSLASEAPQLLSAWRALSQLAQ